MVGSLVFESRGKITGRKELTKNKVEVTGKEVGTFLGEDFTLVWTTLIEYDTPESAYERFEGSYTTKKGKEGTFRGFGRLFRKSDGGSIGNGVYYFASPPGPYEGFN